MQLNCLMMETSNFLVLNSRLNLILFYFLYAEIRLFLFNDLFFFCFLLLQLYDIFTIFLFRKPFASIRSVIPYVFHILFTFLDFFLLTMHSERLTISKCWFNNLLYFNVIYFNIRRLHELIPITCLLGRILVWRCFS